MRYKGYTVTVSLTWAGGVRGDPRYEIRSGGEVVHEGVVPGAFEDHMAAEDAAYRAARAWIDAKCRFN